MAVEPLTWNLTVPLHGEARLGVTICDETNTVKKIADGGVIDDLNKAFPDSIAPGDRIIEVNGKRGMASAEILAWKRGLGEASGALLLKVLRPVEFDVYIDMVDGNDLGCWMLDCIGFLTQIKSEGIIDKHNAKRGPRECLRVWDRLVQVNGRDPAAEDGAVANVLPYLRLALAAGKGPEPLALRWRRGEAVPPSFAAPVAGGSRQPSSQQPKGRPRFPAGRRVSTVCGPEPGDAPPARSGFAQSGRGIPPARSGLAQSPWSGWELFAFSRLRDILTPPAAALSLKNSLKPNRSTPTGKHGRACEISTEVEKGSSTPTTPSTRHSTQGFTTPSTSKDVARLPGVVARTP